MHELVMAEGILNLVLGTAGDRTVESIRLRVGRLHAVVPDSLRFAFQLLGEGTPAAGAALELEEVPITVRCGQCGTISDCSYPPFQCSRCGTADVSVASGAELAVEELHLKDGILVSVYDSTALSGMIASHLADEHGQ